MLQHASSVSHLAVQPETATRVRRASARRPRKSNEELAFEVLRKIVVLTEEAMDLLGAGAPSAQVDDIHRAQMLLLRALATPAQRESEFREALEFLVDANSTGSDSFRNHVVELAWQVRSRGSIEERCGLGCNLVRDVLHGAKRAEAL